MSLTELRVAAIEVFSKISITEEQRDKVEAESVSVMEGSESW